MVNDQKFLPQKVLGMVWTVSEAEPTPSASLEEIRELFRWKLNNNSARKERRIQMDEKGEIPQNLSCSLNLTDGCEIRLNQKH